MTNRETRKSKKQAKADKKAKFMLLYDPNLSREVMLQNGLELSEGTIRNWSKG